MAFILRFCWLQEKNAKQREELRKAPKEGIQIDGGYGQTKLSESFVTEALTLSDALNLSEFACVDLLVSAEQQTANFPGTCLLIIVIIICKFVCRNNLSECQSCSYH